MGEVGEGFVEAGGVIVEEGVELVHAGGAPFLSLLQVRLLNLIKLSSLHSLLRHNLNRFVLFSLCPDQIDIEAKSEFEQRILLSDLNPFARYRPLFLQRQVAYHKCFFLEFEVF